ncbi:MAG: hypothetical protein HOF76_06175 [Candidatus Scalindua sp.]|nr:hypothetical protein [Candidatus Scalindua sp.]
MSSHSDHDQKFTIDTALKDDDNLCDDFNSMGLSIAIGIESCLNDWNEVWEDVWEEWCFTGEVKDSQGVIGEIGGARAKLETAIEAKKIRYIMIPSENRQEITNWIKRKQNINYKVNPSRSIGIKDTGKSPYFFSRLWTLSTSNIFMWFALIIWSLSVAYLPIRYFLWDNFQSLKQGDTHITINLPVKNPKKVRERLLNSGFPHDQIKDIPLLRLSERLVETNKTGRVLFKNRDGVIEFEIINSRDLTLILSYICGGYIVLFVAILVIASLRKESGNIVHKSLSINYDSIHFADMDKEIMFVDNIKQAESIVKYKIC